MDNKALFNLTYGVFMLSTRAGDKVNGCIINTATQVASSPTRIAISVINANYTCDLIKESGVFALSILDQNCNYVTIKHFGMQSGRNVDKMGDIEFPLDINNVPYMGWYANAVISCKVVDQKDLGSHTLFIGEVVDAKVLSKDKPLTYADYHANIKPKAPTPDAAKKEEKPKKIKGWRCKICGYVYEGEKLPEDYLCPLCGHDVSDFEPIYED